MQVSRNAQMTEDFVLANARLVLEDEVVLGCVAVRGGHDIRHSPPGLPYPAVPWTATGTSWRQG